MQNHNKIIVLYIIIVKFLTTDVRTEGSDLLPKPTDESKKALI
jgi:hypothetical protein